MYCNKCGNEIGEGQGFCDKCGQQAGAAVQQQPPVPMREKSAGVAAILSFLWAGLGHLYVGKIGFGLILMLLYPVILFFGFIFLVVALGIFGLILFGVIVLAVWIWCIFDSHRLANEYNDFIRANGRRPW